LVCSPGEVTLNHDVGIPKMLGAFLANRHLLHLMVQLKLKKLVVSDQLSLLLLVLGFSGVWPAPVILEMSDRSGIIAAERLAI
jgi:hypothetical protein